MDGLILKIKKRGGNFPPLRKGKTITLLK